MARTVKLANYKWEDKALISLCIVIAASFYSLTPDYSKWIFGLLTFLGLIFGVWSIIWQIQSSKTKVVDFDTNYWERLPNGEYRLTIESDLMLFRIEMPDSNGNFIQVLAGVATNQKGNLTFVTFSSTTRDDELRGRVVVR